MGIEKPATQSVAGFFYVWVGDSLMTTVLLMRHAILRVYAWKPISCRPSLVMLSTSAAALEVAATAEIFASM